MPSRNYRPTTWYDPRAEIRLSRIQGKGMVAAKPIQEGETVVVRGIFPRSSMNAFIRLLAKIFAALKSAHRCAPSFCLGQERRKVMIPSDVRQCEYCKGQQE